MSIAVRFSIVCQAQKTQSYVADIPTLAKFFA